MSRYKRTEGILVEPMAHLWAAFSATSGETTILNDEGASILEVLESGAADTTLICKSLAGDAEITAESIHDLIDACWPQLIDAGLVRELPAGHTMPR